MFMCNSETQGKILIIVFMFFLTLTVDHYEKNNVIRFKAVTANLFGLTCPK